MATRLLIIPILVLLVSIGFLIYWAIDLKDSKSSSHQPKLHFGTDERLNSQQIWENNFGTAWVHKDSFDLHKRHLTVDFDNNLQDSNFSKDFDNSKHRYLLLMGIIALSFLCFISCCCIMVSISRRSNRNEEQNRPALVTRPIFMNMHPVDPVPSSETPAPAPSAPPKSVVYDLPPSYECAVRNAALYPSATISANQNIV